MKGCFYKWLSTSTLQSYSQLHSIYYTTLRVMHRLFTRGRTTVFQARKVSFAIYRGKAMGYGQGTTDSETVGCSDRGLVDKGLEYLLASDIIEPDIFRGRGCPPTRGGWVLLI